MNAQFITILNSIFAFLTVLSAATVAIITIRNYQNPYRLKFIILQPISIRKSMENLSEDINILFKEKKINDLTKFRFIIHNNGKKPIKKDQIKIPLNWESPGSILYVKTLIQEKPVFLEFKINKNNLNISWPIFNQKCMALIEVFCDCSHYNDFNLSKFVGSIENIPKIEIEQIFRINNNLKLKKKLNTSPLFFNIFRIFFNRIFFRLLNFMAYLCIIILSILIIFSGSSIFQILLINLSQSNILFLTIVSFTFFGIVLFLLRSFTYKNPYQKFINKISNVN